MSRLAALIASDPVDVLVAAVRWAAAVVVVLTVLLMATDFEPDGERHHHFWVGVAVGALLIIALLFFGIIPT